MSAALAGFFLGFGLIVAIGAQNAFVLRQGLRREHVLAVVTVCAVSDAILIATGVLAFRTVSGLMVWLEPVMRYGGAAFLIAYGLRSFASAWKGGTGLTPADAPSQPLAAVIATCLAFTWLNPHVYLDTVVLVGSISTRYPGREAAFALGAMAASFVFFFSLGFGARLLAPLFARPQSWRVLDALIGVVMSVLALRLVT